MNYCFLLKFLVALYNKSYGTGVAVVVAGLALGRGRAHVRVARGRVRAQPLARPAQLAALAALHGGVAAVYLVCAKILGTQDSGRN